MLKRTPGKWEWTVIREGDSYKTAIVVRGIPDGEPLKPTIGDYQLVVNAPAMYELLWEIHDRLKDTLPDEMRDRILGLLKEINVERQEKQEEQE